MVKHSRSKRRHNKKRGGNAFTSSYADAAGLQTTGASNYAAATSPSPSPSPSPASVKGGSSKARGKSMGQSMGQSQSKSRAKGRGRSQGIGGYWAAVLEQAIVPLTLLGIQQTYGRKRHLKGRTFKRRR
jgi:hypothetical protein